MMMTVQKSKPYVKITITKLQSFPVEEMCNFKENHIFIAANQLNVKTVFTRWILET